MSNPYSVSVPFDYRESRAKGTFNDAGVNLDKWQKILKNIKQLQNYQDQI